MDTYTPMIRQLTEAQKIRLLTDIHSLAEPEFAAMGIPQVRCGFAEDGCGNLYPSSAVLARTWDRGLIAEVAEDTVRGMAQAGMNHIFLPGAKPRVTPYGDGLSEDVCLAGERAGAYLTGATRAGVSVSMDGYGFTEAEAAWVDRPMTARFTREFLEAPYRRALEGGRCVGVLAEADGVPPLDGEGMLLCRYADEHETVTAVATGRICLTGSAMALQNALHNYRRLKAAIEHGKVTTGELDAAVAAGEAMSEETLNKAVARLLTFAAACGEASSVSDTESARREAPTDRVARESVVLLENRADKVNHRYALPLSAVTKVCLIGDMATAGGERTEEAIGLLTEIGHACLGYARGYDRRADRNDDLLAEALSLAAKADTVILFLGTDAERERNMERDGILTLPANQLALCDRLGRLGKTVIAVLSSRVSLDMTFSAAVLHPFAALLLAPLDSPYGLQAVMETITGKQNPCGRLTTTLCAYNDGLDRTRGRRRVGPFVGYRYYDTVGFGAAYPFGHGLSYSTFQYADLTVENGQIRFTVKNAGSYAGVEVAQIYVGMKDSAVLRPKKELVGFARVALAPGEETVVTLPWRDIPVYDVASGSFLIERGSCTVYVGASVSDIRLHRTVEAGEVILPSDGEKPSDYLPSVSNILKEHYTLEAEYTPMKPSLRNPLFGIAALALAVSVKIYDIVTASDAAFLDIVAGILAVGAVFFFVMELLDRKKQFAREQEETEAANRALFEGADQISVPSAAELFKEDSYIQAEESVDENGETTSAEDRAYDYMVDVDKELTFTEASRELRRLAAEKGILLDEATACGIFAALASSRLVVVRGMGDEPFAALVALLGEYLACAAAVDEVDESYVNESAVLFGTSAEGERFKKHTLLAMESAQKNPHSMHVAALTGVTWEGISAYFVPYARYVRAPLSACTVTTHDEDGAETVYRIPENLWFMLHLKDGEALDAIPDYVAEVATVNNWHVELTAPITEAHAEFHRFRYGQMLYLCDKVKSAFAIEEDVWKKIDRLEAFVARHGDFRMKNKMWLGLEACMAVLTDVGNDGSVALDTAMAVKLLPAVIHALSGRLPREERGLGETLDVIFGDGCTVLCRKVIKESGADLA